MAFNNSINEFKLTKKVKFRTNIKKYNLKFI